MASALFLNKWKLVKKKNASIKKKLLIYMLIINIKSAIKIWKLFVKLVSILLDVKMIKFVNVTHKLV